jgi:hypothetical protein
MDGPPPSRNEVEQVLNALVEERMTREQASEWASPWVIGDPNIEDKAVRDALDALAGADSPTTDRQYLFGQADFAAWLDDFRAERT